MKLLIAVPTYNEARHVDRVIDSIKPFASDVLIVDDGSSDGTAEVLARRDDVRVLRHDPNQGYGRSLIDAFAYADANGFDWVITMDADGQHEAASIPDFMKAIETDQFDLISGSRYLDVRSNDDLPPPERRNVNLRITNILNGMLGLDLTDSFCGFKAHRVSSMVAMDLDESGYAFPLQLWPRVWAAKLRLKEIPVGRIYNDPNRSFGSDLDDAERRFKHYVDVLNRELVRLGKPEVASPASGERRGVPLRVGCRG